MRQVGQRDIREDFEMQPVYNSMVYTPLPVCVVMSENNCRAEPGAARRQSKGSIKRGYPLKVGATVQSYSRMCDARERMTGTVMYLEV